MKTRSASVSPEEEEEEEEEEENDDDDGRDRERRGGRTSARRMSRTIAGKSVDIIIVGDPSLRMPAFGVTFSSYARIYIPLIFTR